LQDGDAWLWPRLGPPLEHGKLQLARPGRGDNAFRNEAGAIGDIGTLTRLESANRAGVPAFLTAQDDPLTGQVSGGGDEDRRFQDRPARDSAAVEGIA
jgi:hypothetical protein